MLQTSPENTVQTIAIFDLDSTITREDTYLAFLLLLLRKHPLRIFRCMALPFAVILFKTGIKDNSWLKETFLSAIAGGLSREQINICSNSFLHQLRQKGIRPGAINALKFHQQAKHRLIMATASFDFYTQQLGQELGFEHVICTKSSWSPDDKILGKIDGKNCYGKNKLTSLIKHFGNDRQNLYLIGYSDHHTDQPFLDWVDKAVAINPTKKLKKIALQENFEITDW